VPVDHHKDELRRRVQSDPSSIAFAQLAEECRRAGDLAEAVRLCRHGLDRHPGYLSARITLGRSLLELGRLGDAAAEFSRVLEAAPDNLVAQRALDDVRRRTGGAAGSQSESVLAALETWLDELSRRRGGGSR
jgi:predicted Zn-dependent protease